VEAPRLLTSAPVVCSTAAALAATGPAGWWQPNVASVARQVELWRAAHRQARPEAAAAGEGTTGSSELQVGRPCAGASQDALALRSTTGTGRRARRLRCRSGGDAADLATDRGTPPASGGLSPSCTAAACSPLRAPPRAGRPRATQIWPRVTSLHHHRACYLVVRRCFVII
jgi:hypothetical protein